MFPLLNYYSLSLFLGGVVAIVAGLTVYLSDSKKLENSAWLLLNICTAIWSFGYFSMITAADKQSALVSDSILHIGAIFIPLFYFLFIIALTGTYKKYKWLFFEFTLLAAFFVYVSRFSYFVQDVFAKPPFDFAPDAGPLYAYFTIYFFGIVISALVVLFMQVLHSDTKESVRLKYVFLSSIFGFIGGGSVFFLTFNVNIAPFPIILFSLYPIIIAFAILKYNLFNIKLVTTEIFIGILWIVLLFRTVLAETAHEQAIGGVILLLTLILGVFLIKSVLKEVSQRESIERLAKDLERANERLKDLDQLKSEFLSIASHQIRAPITAIKGYASLIIEGHFGKLKKDLKNAIDIIYQSSQSMSIMVDDFLNISRIEQGKMKYDFVVADVSNIIRQVVAELEPSVKKKGLDLQFDYNKNDHYEARVDVGKIKQAVINIIDNAVKYTPKGSISVGLKRADSTIEIQVKDTGVGIAKEVIPKLFEKFSRAKNAITTNVSGTGLGLYVVRQMIEAHQGKVWVESPGEGKGSTFHIELKAASL